MEAGIIIIVVWYALNIVWLLYGFTKVPTFIPEATVPVTRFSVIVPFRNEAENLPKLLTSISKLQYPKDLFEVILVDDASDKRFQIPDFQFQISILNNERSTHSPKKDAINTAMQHAKNDWIITTDADCIVPENWLGIFDAFIQQKQPKMIASGVYYQTRSSLLDSFQQLDLLSLQGTTIGSFGNLQAFMCNGANFCYNKNYFKVLNGFEGNDNIASGDDVFLLQKAIAKDSKNVYFLKSEATLVKTQPEASWKGLFYQRVRWASKTANYNGIYSKQLGISVFLMNFCWVFCLVFWILDSIPLFFFFLIVATKLLTDTLLIFKTILFFKTERHHFLVSNLIYPFFSTAVVLYSFFGSYSWKGRKFKM